MMGATQNIHSCATAQPPTNTAVPVLRAGFTERFVTGIPIRLISVRPRPMANGGKTRRSAMVRGTHDDQQEEHREHGFRNETGQRGVSAGECTP